MMQVLMMTTNCKVFPLIDLTYAISNCCICLLFLQGKVVVIRGEGPKGGPGMPEMLTPTSAIMGAGLGKVYFLIISL